MPVIRHDPWGNAREVVEIPYMIHGALLELRMRNTECSAEDGDSCAHLCYPAASWSAIMSQTEQQINEGIEGSPWAPGFADR